MSTVYAVVGPTGVGKTEFSIKLAKALDGEVINGDAYQLYKELNIGTAKIQISEMDGVTHHLFNIISATENVSVADYQKLAREKIAEVQARGKVPIIVGGSGYYLKTILYDYQFGEQKQLDFSEYSNEELYQLLKTKSSERASILHPNNRIRVERALQNIDSMEPIGDLLYDVKLIGITMDRAELYERINKRVDVMVEAGLVNEIESLINSGIDFSMQAMKAIGYKEFEDYFSGEKTLDEVITLVKRNSRRYAKKQYTWFRNQMDVGWINKESLVNIDYNSL